MRKKLIVITVLIAVILVICIIQITGSEDARKQAVQMARDLTVQRLEEQKPELFILHYEMGDFNAAEAEGRRYVVEGEYQVVYGASSQNLFLEIRVGERFTFRKGILGTLKSTEPRDCAIIYSNIEELDDTWIVNPDDSNYVPFMSREDAAQYSGVSRITRQLLSDFIMHAAAQENSTYILYNGSLEGGDSYAADLYIQDETVLNCRRVDGGYCGTYVGYIEGLGYSCPIIMNQPSDMESLRINRKPFYLVEKEEGYYLYTENCFLKTYVS